MTYHTDDDIRAMMRARLSHDYTQADMARDCGVSPQYICAVLSGRKGPSPRLIEHLGMQAVTVYVHRRG